MSAVIADTHAIVWYLSNLERLSKTALQSLDQASQSGKMIYLSAISIVELQYLIERNRIDVAVLNQIRDFQINNCSPVGCVSAQQNASP